MGFTCVDFHPACVADATIARTWPRAWELRHNLTAYDATFVALAEVLAAPLITCDARLASAPGHEAQIELFSTIT